MDIKNRINGEVYFVTDTVVDWVDIFNSSRINNLQSVDSAGLSEAVTCAGNQFSL